MSDFADALDELNEALPAWWQHRIPTSLLGQILGVWAGLADELADELAQVYDDQFMQTASLDALVTEWGPLFGAAREDLPDTAGNLRAYLQELAADDGSRGALERTLLALLSTDANIASHGQPTLRGLHFPVDGSGLHFPAGGAGLHFPSTGWVAVIEHPATYTLDVQVLGSLAFDRPTFARAVGRARFPHMLAPTITEV